MIQADVLLTVADEVVNYDKPTQEHLRRAVSTVYYAIFHSLCKSNADSLLGPEYTNTPAWTRVYRALDHGVAYRKCKAIQRHEFGTEIEGFAGHFASYSQSVIRRTTIPMKL